MEISKLKINGVEYDLSANLERYLTFIKSDEIINQNHLITLTVEELMDWYKTEQPDYSYFTFTSTNKKLHLYTSRGNSCPQKLVYILSCVSDGLTKDDWDRLNEIYNINCTSTDKITIYYGN